MDATFEFSIPLRQYFDTQLDAVRLELNLQFELHDRALKLATAAMESRLEHLNELREAVTMQESKYLTKGEAQLRFDNLERDVRSLLLSQAKIEGKASQNSVVLAWLLGASGLLLGFVNVFMRIAGK